MEAETDLLAKVPLAGLKSPDDCLFRWLEMLIPFGVRSLRILKLESRAVDNWGRVPIVLRGIRLGVPLSLGLGSSASFRGGS